MNIRTLVSGVVLGAVVSPLAMTAMSQDDGGPVPVPQLAMDMAVQQKAQTLTPQHEYLASLVGDYDVTMKVYFNGPDGPAMEAEGTGSIESVLDGKFTLMKNEFEMAMGGQTMTLKGMGLRGFDAYRNQFVGTWADNINSHMLEFSGAPSADGNSITMYGEMDEPGIGVIGRHIKYHSEVLSDDSFRLQIYDLAVSEDYLVVEQTYTRK